jgi:hypothetical protein
MRMPPFLDCLRHALPTEPRLGPEETQGDAKGIAGRLTHPVSTVCYTTTKGIATVTKPRQVKATGKDDDGDITSLKGGFGEVPLAQAIRDIESGAARYSVGESEVTVVKGHAGKYLRTAPDGQTGNNLDSLPD